MPIATRARSKFRAAALAAAVTAAAGALTGCSASVHVQIGSVKTTSSTASSAEPPVLSATKLESDVMSLTRDRGLAASSASCPAKVTEAEGVVSFCTATYRGGQTVRFRVHQDNGTGYVTISPATMVAPEVENTILAHLVHPAYHGSAQCPVDEPIVTGRVFYCTASQGSTHARVEVRILDGSGLRYHVQVV